MRHTDIDMQAQPHASWREVLAHEYEMAQARLHGAAEDWDELGEYL